MMILKVCDHDISDEVRVTAKYGPERYCGNFKGYVMGSYNLSVSSLLSDYFCVCTIM